MRVHHFFDWEGLAFAAKILLLLVVVVAGGRFALHYASESHAPSLVLIQETRPAAAKSLSLTLSTTTSTHIIHTLTIADTVPPSGKFAAADLSKMVLTLYQDGTAVAKYPILATGEIGSPYETPAGYYTVLAKEPDHFDDSEQIDLPWSVQFSGNYSIHGWPFAADGSPVDSSYAGGDIRLSTADAKAVYDFVTTGTGVFVYTPVAPVPTALALAPLPAPTVSATGYLLADIDTGDVYLEQNAGVTLPAASATRLAAALAANEMLPFDEKDDPVRTYRTPGLVGWMNATTKALDMPSTRFSDTAGTSTENVSTADDLYRLASYLVREKSFILDITRAPEKDLIADSSINNTAVAKSAAVSVAPLFVDGVERRVAIIVLNSNDTVADTTALTDWFTKSATQGVDASTACVTCALHPPYRKIQF